MHETWALILISGASGLGGSLITQSWGWLKGRKRESAAVEIAEINDGAKIRQELWDQIDLSRKRIDTLDAALMECRKGHLALQGQYSALVADKERQNAELALIRSRAAEADAKNSRIDAEMLALRSDNTGLQRQVDELQRVSVGMKLENQG
jgi:chromosome segregation ATPase